MDAAPAIDLVWTQTPGGEQCIGEGELGAKVQAVLAHATSPAAFGQAGGAHVRGTIGPAPFGRGWLAVVEARRGDAAPLRRDLSMDASDCRQLDEAVVLVVALLLDSVVVAAPPSLVVRPSLSVWLSLGPDITVAWGMLPGLSFGFGVLGAARIGPLWPVVLSFHEWPSSGAMEGASGGKMEAFAFGAAVCPAALARRGWEGFACAGASVGQVTSIGVGLDQPRDDARRYVEADAQVGFRFRVADYVVSRLGVGAAFPLTRYEYTFRESDQSVRDVFRTWPVVPFGQVAIELRTSR